MVVAIAARIAAGVAIGVSDAVETSPGCAVAWHCW
jgi:hypothetical protein